MLMNGQQRLQGLVLILSFGCLHSLYNAVGWQHFTRKPRRGAGRLSTSPDTKTYLYTSLRERRAFTPASYVRPTEMLVSLVVYTVRPVTNICVVITPRTVSRWWLLSSTHGIGATRNRLVYSFQIPIGWCAKTGVTVIRIRATKMVISQSLDESTLVDNGSGDL